MAFGRIARCAAWTALAAGLSALALTASAQTKVEVDVELVLAVDVSGSMGLDELRLQRGGYVSAFRHPDVIGAIESGLIGRIAVIYFEWGGPGRYRVVVPWTGISNAEEANALADTLELITPRNQRGTSISGALAQGREFLRNSGFRGLRQVIDVSGDGPNNMGDPLTDQRDKTLEQGIVINGLPL